MSSLVVVEKDAKGKSHDREPIIDEHGRQGGVLLDGSMVVVRVKEAKGDWLVYIPQGEGLVLFVLRSISSSRIA